MRVKLSRGRRAGGFLVGALALCAVFTGSASAAAEISPKLKEGLANPSPKVRIVAVSGVAKSGDPQARALLEAMVLDPDPAVRAAVVEGLGRIGDPGAVPALEKLQSDSDPTVQKVLQRVLPPLEAMRVFIYIGKPEDFSGRGGDTAQKLGALTRAALQQRLGSAYVLHEDLSRKGYGAHPLAIRSVTVRTEGSITFVDVKCELTLVEMPGNLLRAALSTTASAGVQGKVTPRLEKELIVDAVNACAPELAGDVASYVKERAHRR
jgi:hypothetical protein